MSEPGSPPTDPLSGETPAEYHGGTVLASGPPATVPNIPRDPAATGEVEHLRHEELISIHTSLANLCGVNKSWWKRKMEWERVFGALAILLIGAASGGGFGLFAYLPTHPTTTAKWDYIGALIVVGVVGLLCALCRFALHEKEIESVHTVYERVDRIKKSYESGTRP